MYLRKQKGSGNSMPVYMHWESRKSMLAFTGREMCKKLRDLVWDIGSGCLGIMPEEVSTHLVRASFMKALILGGTPVFKVMLVGQWTSDAFIWYIWEQILKFSEHISRNMIQWDKFFTVL